LPGGISSSHWSDAPFSRRTRKLGQKLKVKSGDRFELLPIDLSFTDSVRFFYGNSDLAAGQGVKVGIIDNSRIEKKLHSPVLYALLIMTAADGYLTKLGCFNSLYFLRPGAGQEVICGYPNVFCDSENPCDG
jgi:hypothetical protein